MTLKQFQSGHEVLTHYVNSYRPSVATIRPYDTVPARMTGDVLASALLRDLTNALAELSPKIAEPAAAAIVGSLKATNPDICDTTVDKL